MNGFEKILYTEHRGKINAITSKQIEKEFGYKGKDIRRMVIVPPWKQKSSFLSIKLV